MGLEKPAAFTVSADKPLP